MGDLDPEILVVRVLLHYLVERFSLRGVVLLGTVHYPAVPPVRRLSCLGETVTTPGSPGLRVHLQTGESDWSGGSPGSLRKFSPKCMGDGCVYSNK